MHNFERLYLDLQKPFPSIWKLEEYQAISSFGPVESRWKTRNVTLVENEKGCL